MPHLPTCLAPHLNLGQQLKRTQLMPLPSFEQVSMGWHETQDAAWGMANHRHVGKCQIALPYVESTACARQTEPELLASSRPVPLYFAGAVADFDTRPGRDACPNVAQHAVAVRSALLAIGERGGGGGGSDGSGGSGVGGDAIHSSSRTGDGGGVLDDSLPGAVQSSPVQSTQARDSDDLSGSQLQRVRHNMRSCNGSAMPRLRCEATLKATAARHYASSRLCAVAAGDTPSTGRLYDSIACLCLPLLVTDDVQLPFLHARGAPSPQAYGVRVAEAALLDNPRQAVRRALKANWSARQHSLRRTRQLLAYRTRHSLVATFALREVWASCVHRASSSARPLAAVQRC